MADIIYDSFKEHLGAGIVDMDDHVFKLALLSGSYEPDAGHENFADVSAFEIEGPGYAAGGAELGGRSWTRNGGVAIFDANDVEWTGASFTARYGALYDASTAEGLLVKLFDFGEDKTVSGGAFLISFDALGVLTLS